MSVATERAATAIGRPRRRIDAPEKLTGWTRFAGDFSLPGMLHARLVLSPYAHARIVNVDTAEALRLPGVVAVLTASDLRVHRVDDMRKSDPLARDEALWAGQPVAIAVAETDALAEDAASLVEVTYEPLPAVLDFDAAIQRAALPVRDRVAAGGGAEAAHGTVGSGGEVEHETESANVVNRLHYQRGDVERGFAEAHAVVEQTYRTSTVHQSYLEPQGAAAAVDPLGRLTVWSSTQSLFYTRQELAKSLGLPIASVRIVPMPLGGGFGGKILVVEPLVAATALALGRPVRLVFTRREDFVAGNPANGSQIWLKMGATREGRLTSIEARVMFDGGVFADSSPASLACLDIGGYYRCPNLEIVGYDVMTHHPGAGSYRAPGAPQGTFAIETTIDALARKLSIDPLDMRLANAVREGDPQPDGTPWGRIGLVECLERLRTLRNEMPAAAHEDGLALGTGVAIGGWPGGLEPAAALCRLDQDGALTIVVGSVDMSGTNTTLAAIAAEAFGVPFDQVRVKNEDSDSAPYSGMSGGSKITYTVGRAVQRAAEDARRQAINIAADLLEVAIEDVEIVDGRARVIGAPDRSVSMGDVAKSIFDFGARFEPVHGRGSSANTVAAPGFVAHLANVAVDVETGSIGVRRYIAVQDVGRALNPAAIEGQIHGGVAQGVGWGLYEQLPYDDSGQPLATTFIDYAVPTAQRVPHVDAVLVEVQAADGPFGAKGVGEPPVIPGAAAVANAIADATGAYVTELPITSERLLRAL